MFPKLQVKPNLASLPAGTTDVLSDEWRFLHFERNVLLPAKALVILILFYYLFWSGWLEPSTSIPGVLIVDINRQIVQRAIQYAFLIYVAFNIAGAFMLTGMKELSRQWLHWTVFVLSVLDAFFAGALVILTDGLQSSLFWLFPFLLIRCSFTLDPDWSLPLAQILHILPYPLAVLLDFQIARADAEFAQLAQVPMSHPPYALGRLFWLRIAMLVACAIWLYAFRLVLERIRREKLEQEEMRVRREQLAASSRLAAEIAHKLKNPLAIINNASYTLQRTVKEGKRTITQQIRIIREEVERSDQLITQLMGYAQLMDGIVERVNVRQEIEAVINQVFPPAVKFEINIVRDYGPGVPDLLLQRQHLTDALTNVLVNAREALDGKGTVWIRTRYSPNQTVVISIRDNGPGIPPEVRNRIFEPYFTTKEKGSGLGLSIVKHNVELYGGTVRVESEVGKGTEVILEFPTVSMVRLRR